VGVAAFAALATLAATTQTGSGSFDARLRVVLGILGAALLVGAGLLRYARWGIAGDGRSLVTGAALLFLGGFGMPLTAVAGALESEREGSLLGALTALTTSLLAMVLVVRALNTPAQANRLRLWPMLAGTVGAAVVVVASLVALETWTPALLTSTEVHPALVRGSLLAVAWFCVGLEATLRSTHLPWAGRVAPLLGAMAVAELCGAVGAVHPGHGYRVAAAALVALVAALTMYAALVDLDRADAAATSDRRAADDAAAGPEEDLPVIVGRRADDPGRTVVRPRPRAVAAASLEHLLIRREPPACVDFALQPLLQEIAATAVPGLEVVLVGCDRTVHGRRQDLAVVLRNLLVNVDQHATGPVTVTAVSGDARVELLVADRGPGLAPGRVPMLFQRGVGPAGLGLHVAQTLMRQQDGELELRSHVGGCTFAVTMWAAGGPTPSPLPSQRRLRHAWVPALSPAPCEE
jgi:signal transduction histidine kinase